MAGSRIVPEKITSPIQLMAAWFVMLVLLVSVLLTAATKIVRPEWAAGYLVIFTSIIIFVVIGCVTLMLTKFRPHLQEGKEYAQWLKDKSRYSPGLIIKENSIEKANISKGIGASEKKPDQFKNSVNISIVNIFGSINMLNALKKHGYDADIYEPDKEPREGRETQEAIWLGCNVPSITACQVIKIAVATWPHLKYIHLSNDGGDPPDEVHNMIFLGGSTSSAKSFGINEWSIKDFEQFNEALSQSQLHSIVRKKYL